MVRARLIPDLPRQAWVVLSGDSLSAVGTGLTLPFFVVYLHRVRGLDLEVATLALSALALASLVGNVLSGVLTDSIGARRTLVLGLAGSAAGTAWFGFVSSVWQAFAAAALIGLGNATSWPAQDALLAAAVPVARRSSAFSLRHATLNLGFGIGAVGAAVIASFSSVRSFEVLYVLDAATFAAFALLLVSLRGIGERVAARSAAERAGYRAVLCDRVLLRIWVLAALLTVVGYAQYNAAFAAFASSTGGLSSHALAVAFAVNMFAVALLQLPVLHALLGRRRTSSLALAFASIGLSWAVAVLAGRLSSFAAIVAFALAMGIFAVGETLISPTLAPMVNDIAPDRLRGRYNGMYTLALTVGFVVGPALAGVGLGVGDGSPFLLALVVACAVGCVGSLRLRRYARDFDVVGPTHDEEAVPVPA